jgi:hypothetical protein
MSTSPMTEPTNTAPAQTDAAPTAGARLLICLPSISGEELAPMRARIAGTLAGHAIFIATPGASSTQSGNGVTMVDYAQPTRGEAGWALTASDYLGAAQLASEYDAAATLVLGHEAASLSTDGLQALANSVLSGKVDLALPRYQTGPHDALLSSAMMYPLTNALFGAQVHLPLPLDVAFSARMAARLATVARKPSSANQTESLLWPVAEAAVASFTVEEIDGGARRLPQPSETDLNTLLAEIVGALFSDIEAKAAFWQRARAPMPSRPNQEPMRTHSVAEELDDVRSMAESFRNAYTNLQEIWSLVLPPQSLIGLKRISRAPAEEFAIPADLWARTVYDFVLAYHLRTINRGHLVGALTPLYLAWVASHLRHAAGDAATAALHVEETAAAFVAEKPYIVARWRWPDRFNP